ncbi:3-hydroxybutyryl-CoA dehydrogenase [Paenibacillus baekrokdamisoli]|uniref:3-hydroxybutyryl-CoA dehydrogenase n=1 Tax=Paenibacillus baekrokdamisoli TaxID=1712516 RepID=A0A3G9JGG1_9BACL|nr:3-hydroxybutyryl-CoA dehydrogenase [Paenibacillus baekrokdamisoli]MBB3070828.1 3-hydroxybutyryl-CoA dehydrogenase [Paenibacillus baekrokdamisoli]BBH22234.1 3-hydroxybutyryl-CoA dehydrogenase [Paenibacillus baekrokdamisoli]
MEIGSILVVGAGQMGSGIAQVSAQAECEVLLYDLTEERVQRALASISSHLARNVAKGRITEEQRAEILSRIHGVNSLRIAGGVDCVIEAVTEKLTIKAALFRELDAVYSEETVLATNTSSISVTELAAATQHPERVIGMHFMNPVPVLKLVELIRGLQTSAEVFEATKRLTERMGKLPVEVNDYPGFVSNRILMPMINEAIYTVYEGVASPEAVDQVMKLGMNHPMGPLELADLIGLDTCLAIMETLHVGFGDSKYRPCPLLRSYVHAGWLGRKSGRGFYRYETAVR